MPNTVLALTGMGIPPYSARGLSQTLKPIRASSQQRRTVNGTLVDLSASQFRKFESVISGDDQDPPALEATWPGAVLTVDCIVELAVQGEEATEGFSRTVVPDTTRSADGFTFYRPRLTMMVVDYSVDYDEWERRVGWSLSLEEV